MTESDAQDSGTPRLVRGSGMLLHVTSLPSRFGIGDAGPAAFSFVRGLAGSHQRYWQVLPLNPTSALSDHSPYHPVSAFALNPLFISPEVLVRDGLIAERELPAAGEDPLPWVDFPAVVSRRMEFLHHVAQSRSSGKNDPEFEEFCEHNKSWLDDFALFSALGMRLGECWTAWPAGLRDREPAALATMSGALRTEIRATRYLQYLIHAQWKGLKTACRRSGIRLICDLPMFVAHGSADVWAHRELFRLSKDGTPLCTAGVPPDYFSPCGQRWGNPVYNWDEMAGQDFAWWIGRMSHALTLCDFLRIDHFRGFSAYWEIPAGSQDAREGHWVRVPGRALLSAISRQNFPLIAEDLGTITPEVRGLMEEFHIPGMRVLQFGFDGDEKNPHAPGNIGKEVVLYTGTHDNNTLRGWVTEEAGPAVRGRLARVLGDATPEGVPRRMISLAMESPAQAVIVPVQDLLGLPSSARMNRPGTCAGNWRWRLSPALPAEEDWRWLGGETVRTERA